MFCEKCGTQLEDGALFCHECGTSVAQESAQEPSAAEETSVETNTQEEAIQVSEVQDPTEDLGAQEIPRQAYSAPQQTDKKGVSKALIIVAAAAAAVVVLVLAAVIAVTALGVKSSKNDTLLYLKDNEIMGFKKESYVIGEDAYEDKDDASSLYSSLTYDITISDDGKYIYFPKKYTWRSFALYYQKLGSSKAEEIKIASDVTGYTLLGSGKVLYEDTDDKLYVYNPKKDDKEKIATDVSMIRVSANEKNVFWKTTDNKMYYRDIALKNDKIKLDSDVSSIIYISDDLKKIVYMKEDTLYVISNLEDKNKVASEIEDSFVCENGSKVEIYYTRCDSADKLSVMDFIDDDYASKDENLQKPVLEDYQHVQRETSYWGDTYETTVTDDSYYEALDEYNEKLERDSLRESLEEDFDIYSTKIYRYDEKLGKGTEVTEGYLSVEGKAYQYPVFFYTAIEAKADEQLSLSRYAELSYSEREEKLTQLLADSIVLCMVNGDTVTQIDLELDTDSIDFQLEAAVSATDECYFSLTSYDSSNSTLYKTSMSKSDGTASVVTSKFGNVELVTNKGVYYTAELDSTRIGDLYFAGKQVDSDVKSGSVETWKDGAGVIYLSDPDSNGVGTLKLYNGSKNARVSDDVVDYISGSNGNVAFLSDYNFNKGKGDLKLYSNNKITSIDDDVACILGY